MTVDSYDIALSFAGEDRAYVEMVADQLRGRSVSVFYDRYNEADLWGKDLYTHLVDVYRKRAKFTLMFISKHYREKLWSNHERRAAQSRAFEDAIDYILPARLMTLKYQVYCQQPLILIFVLNLRRKLRRLYV